MSAARPVGANAPLASLSFTTNETLTLSTAIHSSGTVDLTVLDSAIGEQDIVIEAAGSIQSIGGDILLRAGDDLDLRPNASLTALGVVSVWGDFGNADSGSGTAITFSGTVAGATVDLAGEADNDVFIIDDNGEELGGTVNHLLVAISVDGRGGNDTIVLNDESETIATNLKVVGGTVGTSATDNLFAPDVGLSYTDVEDLQIFTGSGDDHVTFASTHGGSTSVNTGRGSDTILVSALDGPTSVTTGDDDDAIRVSSDFQTLSDINGTLTVNGGSSTTGDVLVLDDSGNSQSVAATLTANSFSHSSAAAITYESIDKLDVLLGHANDQLTIASTHLGTTLINSGAGDDIVEIGAITGIAGGVDGTLSIDAGAATTSDLLVVDDSNNSQPVAAILTFETITGFGTGSIVYSSVEQLALSFGSAGDQLRIESTHAGATDVQMNAGDDLVTAVTSDGPTAIDGGEDNDKLQAGNEDAEETILSFDELVLVAQGLDLGRFSYAAFENFDLTTDDSGDNAYFLQVGGGADGDLKGNFGFDPGLPGEGKTISLIDHRGFNSLSFVDSDGAVQFDARLLDGTEQTVDALGNRLEVEGNFQLIVGSRFDDQLFSPLPELQAGSDPDNPFGLQTVISSFADPAVREELGVLLGSFGAAMDAAELGSSAGLLRRCFGKRPVRRPAGLVSSHRNRR